MSGNRMMNLRLAVLAALVVAGGLLAYGVSRETPVGSLKGIATARELGVPLRADVYLTSITKQNGERFTYHAKCGSDGRFSIRGVTAGSYSLAISSEAHHMKPARVDIAEGATQTIEAELQPDRPSLDLYIHQNVFTPGETAQVTCHGFVNADSFDVRLYKVSLDAFLLQSHGSLGALLSPSQWLSSDIQSKLNLDQNRALVYSRSLSTPITRRDTEGVFTQRITLPALPPGLYVAALKSGGLQRLGWLMVTSLGLVTKTVGQQTLVYAVDLKSGSPVPSTAISLYVGSKLSASGKTGKDGIVNLAASGDTSENPQQIVIGRSGDSVAFVSGQYDSYPASDKTVYAYTDRPVYRPSQRVFYKGIVRTRERESYATPKPEPVFVEVRDPSDTLIQRFSTKTDKFGCYSGSVYLDPDAPTGHYSISTSVNGDQIESGQTGFSVAAYRKPEFSVKTTFDRRRYTRGDWVKAKVSVNYYFGSPVADADVHYFVERSPYWLFGGDEYDGSEGYSDYGGYGESTKEGDVHTDENGEAVIEFPATWPQPKSDDGYDTDQQFTVSVTVTDKAGSEATGDGSVVATRGEFALQVSPDSYVVVPGSHVDVDILAMDYNKRPVRRKPVAVTLSRQTWSDDGEVATHTLSRQEIITDSRGRACLKMPVKETGSMVICARSEDSRGNSIVTSSYLYSCRDDQHCDFGPVGDVQIVLDKKSYSPGDTAKALILTKRPGGTALVTVEGDRIYDTRTVGVSGPSAIVTIPIKGSYRPNFYVSVSYVRNKRFATNQAEAKVSVRNQALKIAIKPNKTKYKPGDMAHYKIKVTDIKGKPVSAELSMGVVDGAIYAIEPESTIPIMDFFYAHRENRVRTNNSLPEIYLSDPDKAGAPLGDEQMKIRVRKRFLDTAYWNSTIITNSNGEANISFAFPDNLTTWRTTVRGITLNTMCGQSMDSVISRQPMMVRLEMPRFMVQRDTTTLSAVVHNYTGRDQRIKVRLTAKGLRLRDNPERSVFVRNDGSERLDWSVTAPRPGTFAVRAGAEGETAGDAVQLDLPVKPHGERVITSANAVLAKGEVARTAIYIRRDSIPEAGRFRVSMGPSLVSTMFGSLDYLARYPYGCTEQTTSSFLPDVILYRSLKPLGLHSPRLEAELPKMVRSGFSKLYAFQLSEGGWSWCEYGEGDPWMTAYVCYALIQARESGFAVNKDSLDRGIEWLAGQLQSHKIRIYPRAYGAYVLALSGRDSSTIMEEIAGRHNVNNEALASLALGFDRLGKHDRAKAVLTRLYEHAVSDGGYIHWDGVKGWDGGDVEPTALVLQATLKINPHDPRVYGIVRWLMAQRYDGYWGSTRGTAMALYGMSEFLRISHEMTPNFDAAVQINGKVIRKVHFGRDSVRQPQVTIEIPTEILRKGRNELTITKSGVGNLYYSTSLTQYVEKRTMPAVVTSGLSVTREYYRPSPRYFQTGYARDRGSVVDGACVGQTVLVRLTIRATRPFSHVLLEDNIPAGCEIVYRGDVSFDEWNNWWVGQDVRDDSVSFYLDEVREGKRVVEYQMRAGFAGRYSALPAEIFAMYDPAVRATTGETEFRVR